MQEILPNQVLKYNHLVLSQIENFSTGEAGSKAKPCKLLLKSDIEAGGRILAGGQPLTNFLPLEANRPKAGAGGIPDLGESEGRSLTALSVLEQVAKNDSKNSLESHRTVERKTSKIKGCSIKACGEEKWSMIFSDKSNPETIYVSKFRCKSWRCSVCSKSVRNKDYLRIQKSFSEAPGQYIFCVFTFNPKKIGKQNAYKAITPTMNALIKKIERTYGQIEGMIGIEQHKSGYPHINLVFKFREISFVDTEFVEKFRSRFLVPESVKRGLGKIVYAEMVNSQDRMASYVAKTGLTVISGEVVKVSQVPTQAPYGTRRLRSLRGWLKKISSEEKKNTGGIIKNTVYEIKKAKDSIGNRAIIDLISRKFPDFSIASSVDIIMTENQSTTYKINYHLISDSPDFLKSA